MLKQFGILSILLTLLASACPAAVPGKLPPETRNAALRYWMAFAEMQDPPADNDVSELLEKTAAGESTWDEVKLGPILDRNDDAIRIMQRATKLSGCDWGLEYGLGPNASIAYAPRARVLARLNTLYGMRLAAKGDLHGAVDSWLAGIHFSQDLAKGGTLIFALIAKTSLLSNANALSLAAGTGTLSAADKARVAVALKALPDTAFDWSQALAYEQSAIEIAVKNMMGAANRAEYYQQLIGTPPPASLSTLSSADATEFAKVMFAAEDAMRKTPEDTEVRLKALQKEVDSLNPVYQQMMPSLMKINNSRKQIEVACQKLLGLVSKNSN